METPPELRCSKSTVNVPKTPAPKAKTAPPTSSSQPTTITAPTTVPAAKAKAAPAPPTTTTPATTAAAKPKARPKVIGRLMKNEEGFVGEFRVDTGADETVFGKDL